MSDIPVGPQRIDSSKRTWLIASGCAGAVGGVATAIPFVSTFEPSEKAKAAGAPVEVDIGALKVGEKMSLQGWQAKNGTNFANAEEVTMANGQKLTAASSYDNIKREGVATSGSKTPKPESNEKSTAPKSTAPKY